MLSPASALGGNQSFSTYLRQVANDKANTDTGGQQRRAQIVGLVLRSGPSSQLASPAELTSTQISDMILSSREIVTGWNDLDECNDIDENVVVDDDDEREVRRGRGPTGTK